MKYLALALFVVYGTTVFAQDKADSLKLEQLRRESGVDPTRVQSRVGYTFLIYDQGGGAGEITNRLGINIGVNRWSFNAKYEVSTFTTGEPGTGFTSGVGDIRFSILNAFFVKGKHALAGSAEFSVPTGIPGIGSQYFSVTPAITYSITIKPSLFLAFQPQYTFHLMKDPVYPNLSIITVRSFIAKFTKTGYFFVFETRPIFDLTSNTLDLVFSPIIGKSLGGGFNLIALAEFPTNKINGLTRGTLYQFGINKNF